MQLYDNLLTLQFCDEGLSSTLLSPSLTDRHFYNNINYNKTPGCVSSLVISPDCMDSKGQSVTYRKDGADFPLLLVKMATIY